MESRHISWIPLAPDWEPAETAHTLHAEVERMWNQGWLFDRAETDALMESVCLHFLRTESATAPAEKT